MTKTNCTNTMFAPDLSPALGARTEGIAGAGWVKAAFATLCDWQERALMRHRLASLDDRMLDDMGLTRAAVEAEAAKPFWRA